MFNSVIVFNLGPIQVFLFGGGGLAANPDVRCTKEGRKIPYSKDTEKSLFNFGLEFTKKHCRHYFSFVLSEQLKGSRKIELCFFAFSLIYGFPELS